MFCKKICFKYLVSREKRPSAIYFQTTVRMPPPTSDSQKFMYHHHLNTDNWPVLAAQCDPVAPRESSALNRSRSKVAMMPRNLKLPILQARNTSASNRRALTNTNNSSDMTGTLFEQCGRYGRKHDYSIGRVQLALLR